MEVKYYDEEMKWNSSSQIRYRKKKIQKTDENGEYGSQWTGFSTHAAVLRCHISWQARQARKGKQGQILGITFHCSKSE